MSCGVGHRQGTNPVLLWLWCRPAAVAPIGPLAWEPPCAVSAALKCKVKQNKTNKQKKNVSQSWVKITSKEMKFERHS